MGALSLLTCLGARYLIDALFLVGHALKKPHCNLFVAVARYIRRHICCCSCLKRWSDLCASGRTVISSAGVPRHLVALYLGFSMMKWSKSFCRASTLVHNLVSSQLLSVDEGANDGTFYMVLSCELSSSVECSCLGELARVVIAI